MCACLVGCIRLIAICTYDLGLPMIALRTGTMIVTCTVLAPSIGSLRGLVITAGVCWLDTPTAMCPTASWIVNPDQDPEVPGRFGQTDWHLAFGHTVQFKEPSGLHK
jgi:hypothetical protein